VDHNTFVAGKVTGRSGTSFHLFSERCCLATLVSGKATLATGCAGFFTTPLMGATLLVRNLASLAGNLALLLAIHRREPSIFFAHSVPLRNLPTDSMV
jgi:hypothetical protein